VVAEARHQRNIIIRSRSQLPSLCDCITKIAHQNHPSKSPIKIAINIQIAYQYRHRHQHLIAVFQESFSTSSWAPL
jgi:hypothetical protein